MQSLYTVGHKIVLKRGQKFHIYNKNFLHNYVNGWYKAKYDYDSSYNIKLICMELKTGAYLIKTFPTYALLDNGTKIKFKKWWHLW